MIRAMALDIEKFIADLGGTKEVADLLRIRPPSVSAWKKCGIPDDKLIRLAPIAEARGISKRSELFPNDFMDIWPELREGVQPAPIANTACRRQPDHPGPYQSEDIDRRAAAQEPSGA
jgi:DNA-binding transcriptional regulator YdaS (Cro superfamily)